MNATTRKMRVGVVFGGRSVEHEVSLVSASSVMKALDPAKYEVVPIGIAPNGRWLSSTDALRLLKEKSPVEQERELLVVPDPRKQSLVELDATSHGGPALDVLFPVIHGTTGEDGALQGLFELADIPYVGAGILASAVGMDKAVQKNLLRHARIPVTPFVWFFHHEYAVAEKRWISTIERTLRYPLFVKPANSGSSIGISKAHNRKELSEFIELAARYDRKLLVEQGVRDAREIEISVLGNDAPTASVPGEIIPSNEFYDYDAKYVDGKSRAIIPAAFPKAVIRTLQTTAVKAFRALDGEGMARVDFLVARKTNRIFLSEINTIPGFTSISMYPKLWEASGLSYPALLDRLIALAIERHHAKHGLETQYRPRKDWYKG